MGSMRHDCATHPEELGPYLLGHLSAEESVLVAAAVESCPVCGAEVERLRPVVQALSRGLARLDPPSVAPSPALDRVLESVHGELARQRRTRRQSALVAAALLLVLLTVAGSIMLTGRGGGPRERRVALIGRPGVAGTVAVSPQRWGTALVLDLRGLNPGRPYGAWLADRAGKRTPAGTFRATTDGSASLDLGAALPLREAGVVGVTELGGGGDVLQAALPG